MKLRFAFPLLLAVATVSLAQNPEIQPPPMKMGLWQTESHTEVSSADNSPIAQAMAAHARTVVSQGCMTPETWKEGLQNMQKKRQSADCKVSNMQQDTHKISFDEQCSEQSYSSNVHFEMLLDNEETMHGTATVRMNGPMFPSGMTMNMKMNSKFLSSDCGDVKPGDGKVISQ